MIPHFSATSLDRLNGCDTQLIEVFSEVIRHYDCTVICGHRDSEAQNTAYRNGHSQVRYPDSKHNRYPSLAIDVAPYPIDWLDLDRFRVFGGFVMGVAAAMGVGLRWGHDWDGDWDFKDQSFHDFPHFEIINQPRGLNVHHAKAIAV